MKVNELLQKLNGEHDFPSLGKEVNVSANRLREGFKKIGGEFDKSAREWKFTGDKSILEREITEYVPEKKSEVQKRTIRNEDSELSSNNEIQVPGGTNNNNNENILTNEEIKVLKSIIQEHKSKNELINKYIVYDELAKVPTDAEMERSAHNISKDTLTRLKKYAKERRLPLQDLVELAIIDLLDKYDK